MDVTGSILQVPINIQAASFALTDVSIPFSWAAPIEHVTINEPEYD